MHTKPVLVGVAGFQPTLFQFAMDEARRLKTELRVTHVVRSSAELTTRHGGEFELFAELREMAAGELDPPSIQYFGWWGDPAAVLTIESREACEVVLGTDEVPWLARILHTEVAREVAMSAACPVIVVPPGDPGDRRTGGIVVAIDSSEDADALLRFAFEAADSRREALQIIEAAGPFAGYAAREGRRNHLEDIVDPWREKFPAVRVSPIVEGTRAVAACVLATRNASMLVIGRPRDHRSPMSLDAVTARVLRHAQTPVAIVPLVDHGDAAMAVL